MLAGADVRKDEVPSCLWALQIVTEDIGGSGRIVVVPPDAAAFAALRPIEDAIVEQQRALKSVKASLSVFRELYTSTRQRAQSPLTLLSGGRVISDALEAAVDQCREELLTAQPGGGRAQHLLEEALQRDMDLLERGVRQRTIYQHTARSHQPTLSYIEQVTAAGAEVRTLTEVFERLIICDRRVAFIPVSDERTDTALQIRDAGLVRFLARGFDNAWDRSVAVTVDGSPQHPLKVTSEIQLTILQAVVAGETDDSIARRLGMSRRSVAEHVRKVATQVGSQSRAQLGFLLATSGLLALAPPAPAPFGEAPEDDGGPAGAAGRPGGG